MQGLRRVRVVASGRVQGVFFRASLEDEAHRLGLSGWVRNRRDGRVEAELQGPPEAVEQGIQVCRAGPGRAVVEDLSVEDIGPDPSEQAFRVI